MARACTICNHPKRNEIDSAITLGLSERGIGAKFEVGSSAVGRHRRDHLSPAVVAIAVKSEERRLGSLVDELEEVTFMAKRMLREAADNGLAGQAQGWVREFRSCVELLLKATGALNERPQTTVNIMSSPDVAQLLSAAMVALAAERFADARIVVADAWKSLDAGEVA